MSNYDEILSMLEIVKNNEQLLILIKSFVRAFIKRYC